jgi:hypothetical protein
MEVFSLTVFSIRLFLFIKHGSQCDIFCSHGSEYEDDCVVACCDMQSHRN